MVCRRRSTCRRHGLTRYDAHPSLRGRRVFIFVGRLERWQKGLDLLLEAFGEAGLRDKAALVLVGPDCLESRRALRLQAERLGISRDVVFHAPAFGQDRANLLAAADVFSHPSRWEGLSLSVLAAAAAEKACLITGEADPLGAFERTGAAIIVQPNVSSIAEGLRLAAALSGDELRQIGARARAVADVEFRWPLIAQQLVDAYQHALGDERPACLLGS